MNYYLRHKNKQTDNIVSSVCMWLTKIILRFESLISGNTNDKKIIYHPYKFIGGLLIHPNWYRPIETFGSWGSRGHKLIKEIGEKTKEI